jgi:hypothetical protein
LMSLPTLVLFSISRPNASVEGSSCEVANQTS